MSEISLSPETVLQLAPNFRTRLDAAGHVIVDSPVGTVVDIGPLGFAILSMFSRPLALGDALDRLEAELGGSTDFAPMMKRPAWLPDRRGYRGLPGRYGHPLVLQESVNSAPSAGIGDRC